MNKKVAGLFLMYSIFLGIETLGSFFNFLADDYHSVTGQYYSSNFLYLLRGLEVNQLIAFFSKGVGFEIGSLLFTFSLFSFSLFFIFGKKMRGVNYLLLCSIVFIFCYVLYFIATAHLTNLYNFYWVLYLISFGLISFSFINKKVNFNKLARSFLIYGSGWGFTYLYLFYLLDWPNFLNLHSISFVEEIYGFYNPIFYINALHPTLILTSICYWKPNIKY